MRDGANVVARFPFRAPKGLEAELRTRLQSLFHWTSLDVSLTRSDPITFLREAVCPGLSSVQVRTMGDLANMTAFQGRLVWLDRIRPEDWLLWSLALTDYAEACRNVDLVQRTVFVVVLCGGVVSSGALGDVALVCHDFRNYVDPLDVFVLALADVPRITSSREQQALLAHTVSHVAQWDCFLAEHLLSVPIEQALDPTIVLQQYAEERGWTKDSPLSWAAGTIDGPEDQPIVHSAWLRIIGRSRAIERRIWAAQAAVLLPLVEERRVGLIAGCRKHISVPMETRARQGLVDLELRDLVRLMRRTQAPRRLKERIGFLHQVRNKLAHMEPLTAEQALDRGLFQDASL